MNTTLPSVENVVTYPSAGSARRLHQEATSTELSIFEKFPEIPTNTSLPKVRPPQNPLQPDFLPDDILFILTQPQPAKQKPGIPTLNKSNSSAVGKGVVRPSPANVWNFKRRNHVKHLLDHTPCVCGAGKDISFLYDVPHPVLPAAKHDPWDQSQIRKEQVEPLSKPLAVPGSIVPEEYRIVKHKGVVGLQFHEDKYSTMPVDHEEHLVVFPSMKPNSRYEVIQLKNAFESMMDQAGINDLDITRGPTQMHNLLALIKKEQDIYNAVFSELIRQTTVECAERGELLHLVWNKYHELLNKVPEQIMSLHEEVLAQRALDLRLTDELIRFKGTIGALTSELTDVKDHDQKVTREAQKAQQDLTSALAESQRNASLLAEYHDLYQLQRNRLEKAAAMLAEERDMWSTAAYSLAVKVTEEHKLNTAKRMQLFEKSWVKLASHFTILLSDRDMDMITKIQGHVEAWRDLVQNFHISVRQQEDNLWVKLTNLKASVESHLSAAKDKFVEASTSEGLAQQPEDELTQSVIASVQSWLKSVAEEVDTFQGIVLLNCQETLARIKQEMEELMECAVKMFGRHRDDDSKIHPELAGLLQLQEDIQLSLSQLHDRATGENGLAQLLTRLQSSLESWRTKLLSRPLGQASFQFSELTNLCQVLEDWQSQLGKGIQLIRVVEDGLPIEVKPDEAGNQNVQNCDVHQVIEQMLKWANKASSSIDSEDTRLVEQVSTLHCDMTKWMIQVILRLAPDRADCSPEAVEMALLGSASVAQLMEVGRRLSESLAAFSHYVAQCCDTIVAENTLNRQDNKEDNADSERKDLSRLKTESDQWVKTAQMLMSQLTGMTTSNAAVLSRQEAGSDETTTALSCEPAAATEKEEEDTEDGAVEDGEELSQISAETGNISEQKKVLSNDRVLQPAATEQTQTQYLFHEPAMTPVPFLSHGESEIEEEEKIEILGLDANTHRRVLEELPALLVNDQRGQWVSAEQKDQPVTSLSVVALLQTQLIAAEERAQHSEERAFQAEAQVVALEERLRALEKQLEKHQEQAGFQRSPLVSPAAAKLTVMPHKSPKIPSPDLKEEKTGKKYGKSSGKSGRRS